MDRLVKFCLPLDLQTWLKQYQAPQCESAFAKDIPNSFYNHQMASRLARVVKIRRKYRGASLFTDDNRVKIYSRPSAYCHKKFADRFALYER
jgi:hypothetical protein